MEGDERGEFTIGERGRIGLEAPRPMLPAPLSVE